jgi:putative transposase
MIPESLGLSSILFSENEKLSVVRQCFLLNISRSGLYYVPKGMSAHNLALMQEIDRAFSQ